MSIEKGAINQGEKNEKNKTNEEQSIESGLEVLNEKNEQSRREESNREKFLNELGIFLLSENEIAEMSFSEVISYQTDMKNNILEVQNNLPPKDFEASRAIFDEALSRVNVIQNPADLKRLKKQLNKVDDETNTYQEIDGKVIHHNPHSRFDSISNSLYGRRKLIKKH